MRDLDDTMLELQLRRVLAARLDPLKLDLSADDLEARAQAGTKARARRRPWIVLGLAAALVLPAGWLAAGAPLPRPTVPSVALETPVAIVPGPSEPAPSAPAPSEPAPSAPSAAATEAPVTPSGAYQVIALRPNSADPGRVSAVDVIAIRADGQERLIKRLAAATMPKDFELGSTGSVSASGWMVVSDRRGDRSVLIDLADPKRSIVTGDRGFDPINVAWAPDRRIAFRGNRTTYIVDPGQGTLMVPSNFVSEPLTWAADGSGFVAARGGPVQLTRPDQAAVWEKWTIATGGVSPGFVPVFDPWRGRQDGGTLGLGWSVAGDRLILCPPVLLLAGSCRGSAGFELVRQDATGVLTIWDVTLASGVVDDAMFAANDRGMWLLSQDLRSGRVTLDRLNEAGVALRNVSTASLSDIPRLPPAAESSWPPNIRLSAMAPDDLLARIVVDRDERTDWFLLPTDGVPGTWHRGEFAGYLSSSVADSLKGGAFRPADEVAGP